MRLYSMMCCMLLSPLAMAVQDARPVSLSHDGYRLQTLPEGPARQRWERPGNKSQACGALPAAPTPTSGGLEVVPLVKDRFFNKFFQGGGRLYRLVAQQQGVPRALVIRSGHWTLANLAARLSAEPGLLQRKGHVYLLRLPVLLHAGASLSLRKDETLRLSRDRGAFVITMGGLYLDGARLEAWDEAAGRLATGDAAGAAFQPFLVAWNGSHTVIRGGSVAGLGFAENLARGVTVAEGPLGLAGYELPPPARFIARDASFEGMYSAVDAIGVPELRVCGNRFMGSRQYALHLEGGSGGLLQGNLISGSQGAYAVYLSGPLQQLRVLENDISENQRGGISVSGAREVTLAGNTLRQNYDAVFLQDVDEVLLANNRILDNQRHGVSLRNVGRLRMQDDAIGPNRGVGLLVLPGNKPRTVTSPARAATSVTDSVAGKDVAVRADSAAGTDVTATAGPMATTAGAYREVAVAPARPKPHRLQLTGVRFNGNHSSTLVVERPYSVLLDDVDVLYPGVRRRPVFRGVLNHFEDELLKRLAAGQVVKMEPEPASPRKQRKRAVADTASARQVSVE